MIALTLDDLVFPAVEEHARARPNLADFGAAVRRHDARALQPALAHGNDVVGLLCMYE